MLTAGTRDRRWRHPVAANNSAKPHKLTHLVIVSSALLALGVGCAQAGPCSADIAKIEKALNAPNSPFGPTARQTVGAQLGRQPTPASMARAEKKADTNYQTVLTRAQALDNQNNPACKKTVKKLKALVGM